MRKGRFAKEEIKYIEEKLLTDSPKDIAKYLDRDPESVENFMTLSAALGRPERCSRRGGRA